uniref:THAP-type domain-containing protein n=1 Tax=Clytia hemisphaerica TaxID=252671 RepID=A0A7M5UX08_9CNID
IVGCGICRNQNKYGLFKIPPLTKPEWRQNFLAQILKGRIVDEKFSKKIESSKVWVCEKHYEPDALYHYATRKVPKEDAIPTLNLPGMSNKTYFPRPINSIVKREQNHQPANIPSTSIKTFSIYTYRQFLQNASMSINNNWQYSLSDQFSTFRLFDSRFQVPKFDLVVDCHLKVTLRVFGWFSTCPFSIMHMPINTILTKLETMNLCVGISSLELVNNDVIRHHTISKLQTVKQSDLSDAFENLVERHFYRSPFCSLLVGHQLKICTHCTSLEKKEMNALKMKQNMQAKPIPLKAPITATSVARLKATILEQRALNKDLTNQISYLQNELDRKSVIVNKELHQDLKSIFDQTDQRRISPFMKLFWEEQMKYLKQHPTQVS